MEASSSGNADGAVSNQMAMLVPSFDPSKDDMTIYQQKVEMLVQVWPPKKMPELVTRLILSTTGSAFQKLQLQHQEMCSHQDTKGVQQLITILGGQWGRIALERRFEDIERALYQCSQIQDEAPDSYLARADVMWSKLKARKLDLEEVQAFVVLKGAALTAEDKKRVILDADSSLEGALTYKKVSEAVRLLGAGFFQDLTGARKSNKTKVYTQETLSLVAEAQNLEESTENPTMVTCDDEDELFETLLAEGDEDAIYIADYESAIMELVQNDPDIGSAYSVYTEARRRLTDKFKARGFFPTSGNQKGSQSWSKGKGYGGGKNKGKGKGSRRSLQTRIMETYCKNCWRKGHWKAECPYPAAHPPGTASTSSTTPTAPTSFATAGVEKSDADALTLEFLKLPEVSAETTLDEPFPQKEVMCLWLEDIDREYLRMMNKITREKYSGETMGMNNPQKPSFDCPGLRSDCSKTLSDHRKSAKSQTCMQSAPTVRMSPNPESHDCEKILFATHKTLGVLDTGATKTVIGSDFVADLLENLSSDSRKLVKRCRCSIAFRFGNQATLESTHALIIPIGKLMLKVAIVPGRTPFLVSNTLVRALKASIDAERDVLISRSLACEVPLKLTSKGLYLIDINDLIHAGQKAVVSKAEVTCTFVSEAQKNCNEIPEEKNPQKNHVRRLIDIWENSSKEVPSPSKMLSHKVDQPAESDVKSCYSWRMSVRCSVWSARDLRKRSSSGRPSCRWPIDCRKFNRRWFHPRLQKSSRSQWMDIEGHAEAGHRLRKHSQWKDIPDGVGRRTGMGHVDCQAVFQEPQSRTCDIPEVCRTDGDPTGTRGTRGPSDQEDPRHQGMH